MNIICTAGQRKKVTAVTFFRRPTVICADKRSFSYRLSSPPIYCVWIPWVWWISSNLQWYSFINMDLLFIQRSIIYIVFLVVGILGKEFRELVICKYTATVMMLLTTWSTLLTTGHPALWRAAFTDAVSRHTTQRTKADVCWASRSVLESWHIRQPRWSQLFRWVGTILYIECSNRSICHRQLWPWIRESPAFAHSKNKWLQAPESRLYLWKAHLIRPACILNCSINSFHDRLRLV